MIWSVQTETRLKYRGVIHYPSAAHNLIHSSLPVRLDCADGFAILIDLTMEAGSNAADCLASDFLSNGPPLS
jgi:hypothetical protein